jgi:hypothetical protein
MAKTQTRDVAQHLETEEDMVADPEAALDDGDPTLVAAALGVPSSRFADISQGPRGVPKTLPPDPSCGWVPPGRCRSGGHRPWVADPAQGREGFEEAPAWEERSSGREFVCGLPTHHTSLVALPDVARCLRSLSLLSY